MKFYLLVTTKTGRAKEVAWALKSRIMAGRVVSSEPVQFVHSLATAYDVLVVVEFRSRVAKDFFLAGIEEQVRSTPHVLALEVGVTMTGSSEF